MAFTPFMLAGPTLDIGKWWRASGQHIPTSHLSSPQTNITRKKHLSVTLLPLPPSLHLLQCSYTLNVVRFSRGPGKFVIFWAHDSFTSHICNSSFALSTCPSIFKCGISFVIKFKWLFFYSTRQTEREREREREREIKWCIFMYSLLTEGN